MAPALAAMLQGQAGTQGGAGGGSARAARGGHAVEECECD